MGRSAKNKQAALSEDMFEASEKQLKRYNDEQRVQRKLLEKQKARYRKFDFKNPYAGMQNAFGGLRTDFSFENVYEDLTVDMRAAEFQAQQGAQQRANILAALRGAAGGSGVAALAQTLANQGQLQAQQMAASIGMQERQNQMMRAQGAARIQAMETQMEATREQMIAQGAAQADMTIRGGEAMVQSAEMGRQSTLLGIEYGGMAGANAGVQAAYENQMAGFGAQASMLNSQVGLWGQIGGGFAQGLGMGIGSSDRRLKKNINKIGKSPSGLNIYSFEFKNSKHGKGLFQGVMSDEIPQEAVINNGKYDMVDYSMLDVEFKKI